MIVDVINGSAPMKRLLISGPKGGIGKTTISRNIAVAGALAGFSVATLDLDMQRGLTKWFSKRPDDMASITHFEATMLTSDVQDALAGIVGFDLLIIDTPPSIEDHPESFKILAGAADFIIVPTGSSDDDLDSVRPWMQFVKSTGARAAFVLNRVKPRATGFIEAKSILVQTGHLCPIEVPDYEDIAFSGNRGIGLLELKRAKGADHIGGVWHYVKAEMGL